MTTQEEELRTKCLRILNEKFMYTSRAVHLEDIQVKYVLDAMVELHNQCQQSDAKKAECVWVCNECNMPNYTMSVSQEEIEQEKLSCINCGGFEFHKKPVSK